jgi:5-methylcytosine-specific restriction protein A
MTSIYFAPADLEHTRREKAKARILRASQWWKNQLGQGICYYCEQRFTPSELTMDHRLAIVRGGKSTKSNVVTACKSCNNKKKYLTPFELAERDLHSSKKS